MRDVRYLYRLRPADPGMLVQGPTPQQEAVLEAHLAYLRDLARQGVVLLAGRTLDPTREVFGIVLLAAPDEVSAQACMASDPAVAAGVMHAELFPFSAAVHATQDPDQEPTGA